MWNLTEHNVVILKLKYDIYIKYNILVIVKAKVRLTYLRYYLLSEYSTIIGAEIEPAIVVR